jgi:hypothetical protein
MKRLFVIAIAVALMPFSLLAAECPSFSRTLSRGSSGDDVLQLQQFLVSRTLLNSEYTTGYFGSLTEKAVQQFQCAENIICAGSPLETGWGVAGPRTRTAISLACDAQASSQPSPSSPQTPRVTNTSGNAGSFEFPAPLLNCSLDGMTLFDGQYHTFYSTQSVQEPDTCLAHAELRQCLSGALLGSSVSRFSSCYVAPSSGSQPLPAVVSGLRSLCDASGRRALLLWNAASNTNNYSIRMIPAGTTTFALIADWLTATSFTASTTPGVEYYWWVHANTSTQSLGPLSVGTSFTCDIFGR